ncbi:MAG: NADPH:quinone reductase [Bacteroidetes bacterium GWF2_33_16]|nr:MAG: NADPH:quinone reductase [Bacteroidetes bacterium GWE2_32_14]OFY03075.1 MAG: NADPH:quinone reductase [Bacteroidetes bacterium GWF2_33_16]
MKAVICTKYGPPEVLQVREVETPQPKDNEVMVKIHATSVTASDCIIRGFKLPVSMWIPARLALGLTRPRKAILGLVLSGEIEKTGENVTQFKKGDKVFAHTLFQFGAYAEYICVREASAIALMPFNASFEEAVAIPFGGTLALYYLEKANIQKGQKVLIYGASGAIGTSAVQLARHFGAEVTGMCSTANLDLVRSLGADILIDYTKEDFTDSRKQYDLIFDAVGKKKSSHLPYKKALNPNGKFISVDDDSPGKRAVCKANLIILKELTEKGILKPVIDKIYPLDQIVDAHRYVDKGHKKGNVIITVK